MLASFNLSQRTHREHAQKIVSSGCCRCVTYLTVYPHQSNGVSVLPLANLLPRKASRRRLICPTSTRSRASCLSPHISAPTQPCS